MRLYAQRPDLRLRQALGDAGVVAWIVLWVLVARAVHRAVLVLAEPGRAVEDLGGSVARNMASAAETADRVPVAGDALAKPFQALGDAGSSVSGAGQHAQDAVGTLAFWLAVVLVLLPVGWLLLRWLPGRWRYAREAGAAARDGRLAGILVRVTGLRSRSEGAFIGNHRGQPYATGCVRPKLACCCYLEFTTPLRSPSAPLGNAEGRSKCEKDVRDASHVVVITYGPAR